MASAFFLSRRSSRSASLDRGRPNTTPRTRASARPVRVRGTDAASRATSWPGPAYRKYGAWGRSTRIRLDRRPCRPVEGRRPPIIAGRSCAWRVVARLTLPIVADRRGLVARPYGAMLGAQRGHSRPSRRPGCRSTIAQHREPIRRRGGTGPPLRGRWDGPAAPRGSAGRCRCTGIARSGCAARTRAGAR